MTILIGLLMKTGLGEKAAKALAILLLIALVAGGLVWYHHYVYQSGRDDQLAEDQTKLSAYENQLKSNAEVYRVQENAFVRLMVDQKQRDAQAYKELEDQKQQTITVVKKEMRRYVPVEVDKRSVDANVFTAGWLFQYNRALDAETPGVSGGDPGDVGAATGIAASQVADNAAGNFSEAVARGKVIGLWQRWYKEKFKAWEDFRNSQPENPALPVLSR